MKQKIMIICKPPVILLTLLALLATGCNYPVATTQQASLPTQPGAPPAAAPTLSEVPPAAAPTAQIQPAASTSEVVIFLIAGGDQGRSGKLVGCGDSVVPVRMLLEAPASDPLKISIDTLLSIHEQVITPAQLYNALYQSRLQVESLEVDGSGEATLKLTGQYALGGVCDSPRFKAQLEETLLQFPQVKTVTIYINGVKLEDLLSGQG